MFCWKFQLNNIFNGKVRLGKTHDSGIDKFQNLFHKLRKFLQFFLTISSNKSLKLSQSGYIVKGSLP